jgi:hypothetical protein
VLAGLGLSLGLAIGLVILAEQLDTSFHNIDELRAITSFPVLVSIPRIVTEGDVRRTRWRAALVAAVAVCCLTLVVGASYFVTKGNENLLRLVQGACERGPPMYLDFYGLKENAFSTTPDPRFLYPSPAHREALAQVLYGVHNSKGFIVLTGEVGTGKTTCCTRCAVVWTIAPRSRSSSTRPCRSTGFSSTCSRSSASARPRALRPSGCSR